MASALREITDGIGWRYILPGPQYFRELRIGRVAPEMRGELNRIRLLKWVGIVVLAPLVALVLPFHLMRWISDAVLDARLGIVPDFVKLRQDAVRDAYDKVPLDELRRRMGEPTSRLLPKKDAATS